MVNISAVIIAKDAENLIGECIESVSFCKEIIVIDDNSLDRTREIAIALGAKVYSHSSQSFAEQRNFGLKKVKSKWIIYIDSDERVSAELKNSILAVINKDYNEHSVYNVQRKNFYLGNHEWPYIERLKRLFRNDVVLTWRGTLHETPEVSGTIGELGGYLKHYSHRDLSSMLAKTIRWSETEARLRFEEHHPVMKWWRFPRVMVGGFYNSYIHQKGFKAGQAGLIESLYQAFSLFATYARLWELQQEERYKYSK